MYIKGKLSFCHRRIELYCKSSLTAKRETSCLRSLQRDGDRILLTHTLMETDAEHSAGEQIDETAELLFSFYAPLCFFFFFFLNPPKYSLMICRPKTDQA